jgi:hypothetical protein
MFQVTRFRVALVLALVIASLALPSIGFLFLIDQCLDHGGVVDYVRSGCWSEGAPAGAPTGSWVRAPMVGSYALAGALAAAASLVFRWRDRVGEHSRDAA